MTAHRRRRELRERLFHGENISSRISCKQGSLRARSLTRQRRSDRSRLAIEPKRWQRSPFDSVLVEDDPRRRSFRRSFRTVSP